jgi:hypothetical protein
MSSNTVVASNFNTQKLTFSQLKVLDNGGKQCYANYENGSFVFQTPNCYLPYGMNAFDKSGPVKYSVELSLRGYDEAGNKMKPFHDALNRLDEFMIDQGVKNSKQWFKSEMSRDVIKAFYSPMIRLAKDREGNPKPYPPTIKLNLRQKRDSQDFDVVCFDEKRMQYKGIPLEELLVKGAQVTCLIQCTGVWFAGMKYGLSWKLSQAIVTSLPQSSRNLAFVDSELDASDATPAPSKKAPAPAIVDEAEDDASEASDGEDEAFSAPPPKKPSVVAAVLPKAPPAPEPEEEDADDAEPVPVPKKTNTVIKKKVISKK